MELFLRLQLTEERRGIACLLLVVIGKRCHVTFIWRTKIFKLSYSLNSADLLPIEEVCNQLLLFGYSGVELSFQREQFDPFTISEERIDELRAYFSRSLIKPICISTATSKFLSKIPHEPSLININKKQRNIRRSLIERGIKLAHEIGVPLVSFQSGYLRAEHAGFSRQEILKILAEEIKIILQKTTNNVNIILEPEPGMFIEKISEATELIDILGDSRFGLHLDIGHTFCSEENYIESIRQNACHTKYIHMADIKDGFDLKYQISSLDKIEKIINCKKYENKATLYDVNDNNLYIFSIGFRKLFILPNNYNLNIIKKYEITDLVVIERDFLDSNQNKEIKNEIIAYLDSVSGVSYEKLLRAYDAIATLRLGNSKIQPIINRPVCNTINGKVHYHDLFGKGEIDYDKTISILIESGYSHYCTVELYNHASIWRDIAPMSIKYILSKVLQHFGWNSSDFGHIDHTKVVAPYIRASDAQMGPEGGVVVLYDLRLSQPNVTALPAEALHTLEHCFLGILPNLIPGFLGIAPMGCQTGLYLITAFPIDSYFLKKAIINAFNKVIDMEEIPYQSEKLCGMAKNHDLLSAKSIARSVLAIFINQN